MLSGAGSRISSAHVIAVLALFVALGGGAYAGSKIGSNQIKKNAVTTSKIKKNAVTPAKLSDYADSGLIKLSNGKSRTVLKRGPFQFRAKCVNNGGGSSTASLTVKNTSNKTALFESEDEGNYSDPELKPGKTLNAFEAATGSGSEWWGNYYNNFSATSRDGKTSLLGRGNIGVKVLGSDCVFQMFVLGS
jgi:hypothetical protein